MESFWGSHAGTLNSRVIILFAGDDLGLPSVSLKANSCQENGKADGACKRTPPALESSAGWLRLRIHGDPLEETGHGDAADAQCEPSGPRRSVDAIFRAEATCRLS